MTNGDNESRAADAAGDLIDCARSTLRAKHLSLRTQEAYVRWIRRFVYHASPSSAESVAPEAIVDYLDRLDRDDSSSRSMCHQARSALLFLYRNVLGRPGDELDNAGLPASTAGQG